MTAGKSTRAEGKSGPGGDLLRALDLLQLKMDLEKQRDPQGPSVGSYRTFWKIQELDLREKRQRKGTEKGEEQRGAGRTEEMMDTKPLQQQA